MKTLTDPRKSTSHRLAIIDGHLKKVRRMVDDGSYCLDTIHQSRAIQQALRKFDEQILREHLRTCLARDAARSPEKAMGEILEALQRL